jgi:hypothetical protein
MVDVDTGVSPPLRCGRLNPRQGRKKLGEDATGSSSKGRPVLSSMAARTVADWGLESRGRRRRVGGTGFESGSRVREKGGGVEEIGSVRLPESEAASGEAGDRASGGGWWRLGSRRENESCEGFCVVFRLARNNSTNCCVVVFGYVARKPKKIGWLEDQTAHKLPYSPYTVFLPFAAGH